MKQRWLELSAVLGLGTLFGAVRTGLILLFAPQSAGLAERLGPGFQHVGRDARPRT